MERIPLSNYSTESTSFKSYYTIRHRVQNRRELKSLNTYKPCENDAAFVNGKCECIYPFVGSRCVDYACGNFIISIIFKL